MNNGHRPNRGRSAKATHFWPTTKRLIAYLAPWKWGVIISIFMAICSVILSILAPKILGEATTTIYNGVLKDKNDSQTFKLRIWISDSYVVDQNSSMFSFKVNVRGNV